MRDYTVALLRDQLKLRDDDPAVIFAGAPLATTVGTATSMLKSAAGCTVCEPDATDLEAGLLALGADHTARQGPIAIVTDGWENRGNADAARNALHAAGIQLYIFTPPGAQSIPNVAMTQLTLPPALTRPRHSRWVSL